MADTSYGVNHPLAVKQWARKLYHEALKETYVGRFMGSDSSSLIQIRNEVSKDAGDRITVGLRMQLSGAGVAGDDTLEGNEEALTTYSDNVLIDQLRHAVRSGGKMSEQRVPFSVREEALMGLKDWWADRFDQTFFNHITGATDVTDLRYLGANASVAPSTTSGNTRILYADGGSTTEASFTASQYFQLSYIDRAVTTAKTASPVIRPIKHNGGEYYVMFLHPFQTYKLRTDVSTARITWFDAQKDAGPRSDTKNNIFTGALGIYNNVILHESTRIPLAPSQTTVRRAVLCGAQAASVAFGKGYSKDSGSWAEEMFDYGNQLGVEGGFIYGMKKMVFNSIDFATVVVSTYAVAP